MSATTRPSSIAGRFYPSDPGELESMVREYLEAAPPADEPRRIIIAPHAGFVFSGPVAGSAFRQFEGSTLRRVLVMGPSHFVPFNGLALSTHSRFSTPLGEIEVDTDLVDSLEGLDGVHFRDEAHAREHSIETHLPFLQTVLPEFKLVPVVVGSASDEEVQAVIEASWQDDTLISISTDLSHFHTYAAANQIDRETAEMIQAGEWRLLDGARACGFKPVRGLMRFAREEGMRCEMLDLRNSGDTAGDRDRVVGYGAFAMVDEDG